MINIKGIKISKNEWNVCPLCCLQSKQGADMFPLPWIFLSVHRILDPPSSSWWLSVWNLMSSIQGISKNIVLFIYLLLNLSCAGHCSRITWKFINFTWHYFIMDVFKQKFPWIFICIKYYILGQYRATSWLPEGRPDVRQCLRVDIQGVR